MVLWSLLVLQLLVCTILLKPSLCEVEVDGSSQQLYLRPRYHITPPMGHWMNDPNGPFYDVNTRLYHLFYQYNPFGYNWGNMSWNHVYSRDLLHWVELPVALFPDDSYDCNGVFSGSIFMESGSSVPSIYYTCVDAGNVQKQCAADPQNVESKVEETKLFVNWKKRSDNPIIPPPTGCTLDQFRDPFLWVQGNGDEDYENNDSGERLIVAAEIDKEGVIPVYSRPQNGEWEYIGNLWSTNPSVTPNPSAKGVPMVECPDFYPVSPEGENYNYSCGIDEALYVLKYSLMETRRDYYELGCYNSTTFIPNGNYGDVDVGAYFAYYASKTFWDSKMVRRLLWGWASETDDNASGRDWQGVMALPRVVEFEASNSTNSAGSSGILRFLPLPELDTLHGRTLIDDVQYSLDITEGGSTCDLNTSMFQGDVQIVFNFTEALTTRDDDCDLSSTENATTIDAGISILACPEKRIETLVGVVVDPVRMKIFSYLNTEASGGTTPAAVNTTEISTSGFSYAQLQTLLSEFRVRILIDHSIVEIFFADGLSVATLRIYAPQGCEEMSLYSKGDVDDINGKSSVSVKVDAFEMTDALVGHHYDIS